uniref:Uncharacterized protein n=1 Tax=Moniliophthora roreri TaxID=221103 RepID=A0A0W0FQ13_MONRR
MHFKGADSLFKKPATLTSNPQTKPKKLFEVENLMTLKQACLSEYQEAQAPPVPESTTKGSQVDED